MALAAGFGAALAPASAAAETARPWPLVVREQQARVNEAEWRLARTALAACAARGAGFGVALDSVESYAPGVQDDVRDALAMKDGAVTVVAIARGSPSEAAGLEVGDRIRAINGVPLDPRDDPAGMPTRVAAQLAGLSVAIPAELEIERAAERKTVNVVPVERCSASVVLKLENTVDAYSDEANIAVTIGLTSLANDEELALLIGHELAHVILYPIHRETGVRMKRKEDAADLYGARLAACSGYDLARASQWWRRFDAARTLGFLPNFTHRKGSVRDRQIAAILPIQNCADWAP